MSKVEVKQWKIVFSCHILSCFCHFRSRSRGKVNVWGQGQMLDWFKVVHFCVCLRSPIWTSGAEQVEIRTWLAEFSQW